MICRDCEQTGCGSADVDVQRSVMGAGLWSASPLSKPSTQTIMVSLFGMVPARLKPLTGLLGVVSWSMG